MNTTKTPDLSAEQRNAMLRKQKGKCPICRVEIWQDAHADHDHATGQLRGLLCRACNIALGRFHDDKEAIKRCLEYLGERGSSLDELAGVLASCLMSPNVCDSNGEAANVVDAIDELARSGFAIAKAINGLAARNQAPEHEKEPAS